MRLDVEPPFQERLGRRGREDRLTSGTGEDPVQHVLGGPPTIRVELNTILEPANEQLLGMKGDAVVERRSRSADSALHSDQVWR